MNSQTIKTKILYYFRYMRRYFYIGTEVGPYNCDVLVSNECEIIEIEVKTTFADLKNELKKRKHIIYENGNSKFIPNKVFFAVPECLKEKTLEFIVNFPKYGILIANSDNLSSKSRHCYILKSADEISNRFSVELHNSIIKRSGSELIRIRLKDHNIFKLYKIRKKLLNIVEKLKKHEL